MAGIEIVTLGRLAVVVDGAELPGLSMRPVRAGLLVFLAIEGEVTRDAAVGCIWPEHAPDRARHALSQTLYQLRKDLGDGWIEADGSYLRCTDMVSVDATEFAEAVQAEAFDRALALYRGPFLPSCYLVASTTFQQWVDRRESRLAELHRQARVALLRKLLGVSDLDAALHVARDWVEISPLEDEPRQHVIRLHASAGAPAKALRQYDEFARLLSIEGLEPLFETRALIDEVLRSDVAPRDPPRLVVRASEPGSEFEPSGAFERNPASPRAPRGRRSVPRLIAVGALLAAAAIAFLRISSLRMTTPGSPLDIVSVAVLPLENRGEDSDQFLVDGVHEALIENLAARNLHVISRASVMRYRNGDASIREVARALDVDAVVEGAVVRRGDSVSVDARSIDGATGDVIATIALVRPVEQVPALMHEASAGLFGGRARATSPDDAGAVPPPPVDPVAYEAYVLAQHLVHSFDVDSAITLYEHAIALDASFGRARSGLAQAHFIAGFFGVAPRTIAWPEARAQALLALERDSALAGAHTVLGYIALYDDWNWAHAETELLAALRLDRNDVLARHGYADLLTLRGLADEGLRQVELAHRVDPLSPLMNGTWIGHLYIARRFEQLLVELPQIRERLDSPMFAADFMAAALWQMRRFDEAVAEYRRVWSDDPELVDKVDRVLALRGPHEAIRAAADHAGEAWAPGEGSPYAIARLYALAGARDESFTWLERAYTERRPQLVHFTADPTFDDVRADPRYVRLVERMGLTPVLPTAPAF